MTTHADKARVLEKIQIIERLRLDLETRTASDSASFDTLNDIANCITEAQLGQTNASQAIDKIYRILSKYWPRNNQIFKDHQGKVKELKKKHQVQRRRYQQAGTP